MLSSALAELVAYNKEDKQISDGVEGVEKKETEEKDVSKGIFPVDDTKKELTVE